MTKYPKLVLTITKGNSTKNVEFTNVKPKADLTNATIKELGGSLAEAFGLWDYTGGQYIEAEPIGVPD